MGDRHTCQVLYGAMATYASLERLRKPVTTPGYAYTHQLYRYKDPHWKFVLASPVLLDAVCHSSEKLLVFDYWFVSLSFPPPANRLPIKTSLSYGNFSSYMLELISSPLFFSYQKITASEKYRTKHKPD